MQTFRAPGSFEGTNDLMIRGSVAPVGHPRPPAGMTGLQTADVSWSGASPGETHPRISTFSDNIPNPLVDFAGNGPNVSKQNADHFRLPICLPAPPYAVRLQGAQRLGGPPTATIPEGAAPRHDRPLAEFDPGAPMNDFVLQASARSNLQLGGLFPAIPTTVLPQPRSEIGVVPILVTQRPTAYPQHSLQDSPGVRRPEETPMEAVIEQAASQVNSTVGLPPEVSPLAELSQDPFSAVTFTPPVQRPFNAQADISQSEQSPASLRRTDLHPNIFPDTVPPSLGTYSAPGFRREEPSLAYTMIPVPFVASQSTTNPLSFHKILPESLEPGGPPGSSALSARPATSVDAKVTPNINRFNAKQALIISKLSEIQELVAKNANEVLNEENASKVEYHIAARSAPLTRFEKEGIHHGTVLSKGTAIVSTHAPPTIITEKEEPEQTDIEATQAKQDYSMFPEVILTPGLPVSSLRFEFDPIHPYSPEHTVQSVPTASQLSPPARILLPALQKESIVSAIHTALAEDSQRHFLDPMARYTQQNIAAINAEPAECSQRYLFDPMAHYTHKNISIEGIMEEEYSNRHDHLSGFRDAEYLPFDDYSYNANYNSSRRSFKKCNFREDDDDDNDEDNGCGVKENDDDDDDDDADGELMKYSHQRDHGQVYEYRSPRSTVRPPVTEKRRLPPPSSLHPPLRRDGTQKTFCPSPFRSEPRQWSRTKQHTQSDIYLISSEDDGQEYGAVRNEEHFEHEGPPKYTHQAFANNYAELNGDGQVQVPQRQNVQAAHYAKLNRAIMHLSTYQDLGEHLLPIQNYNTEVAEPPRALPRNIGIEKKFQLSPKVAVNIRDVDDGKWSVSPMDQKKEVEIRIMDQVVISVKGDEATVSSVDRNITDIKQRSSMASKLIVRTISELEVHAGEPSIETAPQAVKSLDQGASEFRTSGQASNLSPCLGRSLCHSTSADSQQPASFFGWLKRTCTPGHPTTSLTPSSTSSIEDSNTLTNKKLTSSSERKACVPDPQLQRLIKLERLLQEKLARNPELRRLLTEEEFVTNDEPATAQERYEHETTAFAVRQRAAQEGVAFQADIDRLLRLETEVTELVRLQGLAGDPLFSKTLVADTREKMMTIGERAMMNFLISEGIDKEKRYKEKNTTRDLAIDVQPENCELEEMRPSSLPPMTSAKDESLLRSLLHSSKGYSFTPLSANLPPTTSTTFFLKNSDSEGTNEPGLFFIGSRKNKHGGVEILLATNKNKDVSWGDRFAAVVRRSSSRICGTKVDDAEEGLYTANKNGGNELLNAPPSPKLPKPLKTIRSIRSPELKTAQAANVKAKASGLKFPHRAKKTSRNQSGLSIPLKYKASQESTRATKLKLKFKHWLDKSSSSESLSNCRSQRASQLRYTQTAKAKISKRFNPRSSTSEIEDSQELLVESRRCSPRCPVPPERISLKPSSFVRASSRSFTQPPKQLEPRRASTKVSSVKTSNTMGSTRSSSAASSPKARRKGKHSVTPMSFCKHHQELKASRSVSPQQHEQYTYYDSHRLFPIPAVRQLRKDNTLNTWYGHETERRLSQSAKHHHQQYHHLQQYHPQHVQAAKDEEKWEPHTRFGKSQFTRRSTADIFEPHLLTQDNARQDMLCNHHYEHHLHASRQLERKGYPTRGRTVHQSTFERPEPVPRQNEMLVYYQEPAEEVEGTQRVSSELIIQAPSLREPRPRAGISLMRGVPAAEEATPPNDAAMLLFHNEVEVHQSLSTITESGSITSNSNSSYRTPVQSLLWHRSDPERQRDPRSKYFYDGQLRRHKSEIAVYFFLLIAALICLLAVVDLFMRKNNPDSPIPLIMEPTDVVRMTAMRVHSGISARQDVLNWTTAPCRDFHGFACQVAAAHGIGDNAATSTLEEALLQSLRQGHSALQPLWRECVNASLGSKAWTQFRQLLSSVSLEGWPFAVDSATRPPAAVWDAAAQIIRLTGVSALVSLAIRDHPLHRGKVIVALEPPDLLINASAAARNWTVLWHTRAAATVLGAFGLDEPAAAQELTAVERRLALISSTSNIDWAPTGRVEKMTSVFRLRHFVTQVLHRLVHVSDATELWLRNPGFTQSLLLLLDGTPPRVLLNYLGFRLVVRVAPFLPEVPGNMSFLMASHLAQQRPLAVDAEHACLRLAAAAQPDEALIATYATASERFDRLLSVNFSGLLRTALQARLEAPVGLLDTVTRARALKRLRRLQPRLFFPAWVRQGKSPNQEAPLTSKGLAAFVEANTRMTSLRQSVFPEVRWLGSPLDSHCSRDSRSLYVPASFVEPSLARLSIKMSVCLLTVLLRDAPASLFNHCFPPESVVQAAAVPVSFDLFRGLQQKGSDASWEPIVNPITLQVLSPNQHFFVHLAADFCQSRLGVNLPLRDSAHFKKAFRCRGRGTMMPRSKCAVWSS